jgi:hypothetical protein
MTTTRKRVMKSVITNEVREVEHTLATTQTLQYFYTGTILPSTYELNTGTAAPGPNTTSCDERQISHILK